MTQENEAPELLPCPFCGGDAAHDKAFPGRHRIVCTECGAANEWMGQVMDCPTPPPERRKAAWNTRADLARRNAPSQVFRCRACGDQFGRDEHMGDAFTESHTASLVAAYGTEVCYHCADQLGKDWA